MSAREAKQRTDVIAFAKKRGDNDRRSECSDNVDYKNGMENEEVELLPEQEEGEENEQQQADEEETEAPRRSGRKISLPSYLSAYRVITRFG